MPNGDGPWTKYQASPAADTSAGPWAKYASPTPLAAPSTTDQAAMFQRRARGTNPALTRWASANPLEAQGQQPEQTSVGSVARQLFEGVGSLAQGATEYGKQILFPKGATEGARLKNIWQGVVQKPLEQEQQQAQQTTGAESFGHSLASYLPIVGPMAAGAGEQFGQRNYGGGAVQTIALLGGEKVASRLMQGAVRLAERQPNVTQGYVGLNRSLQNAAMVAENNITGQTGAIGRHAQAVIAESARDAQAKSLPGEVDATAANQAGTNQATAVKRPELIPSHPTWYTLSDAKDVISRLGKQAIKLDNSGKAPEASVLWSEYDALRKATQKRAADLGGQFDRSWNYYIDEFHNYMQARKGLLGDILDAQTADQHMRAVDKLTGGAGTPTRPEVSAQHPDVPRIKEWLNTYGARGSDKLVDMTVEQGQRLNSLTQQSKNLYISKLRGLINHPYLAGTAGAGAMLAASATGLPMMHVLLPLLVIGKVAGLLDAKDAAKLVREVQKRAGPEMMNAIPAPQGEPPMPQPGTSPAVPPAAPVTPAGPAVPTPGMSSPTMFGGTSKGALAGKLKGARGSRAQSGVYGGKRGGTKP